MLSTRCGAPNGALRLARCAVKIAAVLTVTDVEPGDTITIGAPHPASADPRQVRIFFPQTGLEGNFEFHAGPAGPSGCAFLVHQSSANFAVPAACRSSTTGNIDLLAFDRTSSPTEEPVQFAAVDVAAPAAGEVAMTTIAAWRTDFQSVPVDIANAPADLTSRRVALSPVRDRKAVGGGFATRTLPASLQLIPYGEHALRSASVASFDDALQIVDVVAQPLAATVFDMATVPYRITAITMTGLPPTATWTTSAAPDADMGIACVFWPDNFEWCAVFDPARPTVPFPSLPDGILPDEAPSQIGLVLRATSVFAGYADARRDSQNPTGSDGVRIPTDLVMHDVVRFPEPFTIWSL